MKYSIDQLIFLKNVAFFKSDAIRDMRELGISKHDAQFLTSSDAFKNANVVEWLQYYKDEYRKEIELYFNSILQGCDIN